MPAWENEWRKESLGSAGNTTEGIPFHPIPWMPFSQELCFTRPKLLYSTHRYWKGTWQKCYVFFKNEVTLKKIQIKCCHLWKVSPKKPMQLGPSWVSVTPCIIITVLPKLLHFVYMFLSSVLNSLNNETCYSPLCTSNTLDSAWSMRVQ